MRCGTRRDHLCWWGKMLFGGIVLPLPACAGGEGTETSPTPPAFETLKLSFEQLPTLKEVGGVATVDQPELLLTLILIRLNAEQIQALWRICPHGACDVIFETSTQELVCPCHGSRFDVEGNLLEGPAERALTRYVTYFDDAYIYVTSHIPV